MMPPLDAMQISPEIRSEHQLLRLNELLSEIRLRPFYRDRLSNVTLPLTSLDQLSTLPLLQKSELISDDRRLSKIFDRPQHEYVRLHQTSGTKGFPLAVADTLADWNWWLNCWDFVLSAAQVTNEDIALMAFSFGPFIGFWTANDALIRRGAMVVPGGGMSSENRLSMLQEYDCTLVCCTPTYALHLVTVAEKIGFDLAATSVTRLIVAGEPGGSIPAIRNRIEQAWNARVIDHTGASELGAWGFGSSDGKGIHVIETEFIAERLKFDRDHPEGMAATDGEEAELVLTNLGRYGGPAIRYRTGDIVRGYRQHDQDCNFLWLDGGVLGRADDMLVIRGVNIFPSSIEAIVRDIEPTCEFRMIATRHDEMDQLQVEIESSESTAEALSIRLRDRLAMRVAVDCVPAESLPRFEAKSRRLIDRRQR
ncbi:MAG: phenylacetate--CoA ligase family protein [Planctomycetota bacterium]|nr:phenylacetate--CoA ligase family protein [Planctomycetota bacterium]